MVDGSHRNIIVRLPNWIGDAVMAMPAVSSIIKARPDSRITLLGKPSVNELYRYREDIDRILDFRLPDGKNKLSSLREFSKSLRDYHFDLGIVLPDSFSSVLVFKLGKVGRIVGYRSELRSFMLNSSLKQPDTVIHRSQKYLNLVSHALGVNCGEPEASLSVTVPEETKYRAEQLASELGQYAVICPTSRAPSRRWGKEKYTKLAKRISREMNLSIVLAGAPEEADILDRVGKNAGMQCHNLARDKDILFSTEMMKHSEVFVGNDSGAAHLAAVSGTRVVSISGADDPIETRPLASVGRIVNGYVECSPCVKNICPRKEQINLCMDVILVDHVVDAVREILEIEKAG